MALSRTSFMQQPWTGMYAMSMWTGTRGMSISDLHSGFWQQIKALRIRAVAQRLSLQRVKGKGKQPKKLNIIYVGNTWYTRADHDRSSSGQHPGHFKEGRNTLPPSARLNRKAQLTTQWRAGAPQDISAD